MGAIETIQIKDGDGYIVINADQFDPAVHQKFGEPDPVAPAEYPLDDLNAEKSIALIESAPFESEAEKNVLDAWAKHESTGKNRKTVMQAFVVKLSPTLEQYEAGGYKAETYPPQGCVEKPSPRLAEYKASLQPKS